MVDPAEFGDHLLGDLAGEQVGQHQVAAGAHFLAEAGDGVRGRFVVGDEVQDGAEDHRHRFAEIDSFLQDGVAENALRVGEVSLDDRGLAVVGQQGTGVRQDRRVVIDVDDPGVGGVPQCHLVHVLLGRQPGADVEELPDPGLGQGAHGPDQEGPVAERGPLDVRARLPAELDDLLGGDPVGLVVVLAAQVVVVHPGDARNGRIDPGRHLAVPAHAQALPSRVPPLKKPHPAAVFDLLDNWTEPDSQRAERSA